MGVIFRVLSLTIFLFTSTVLLAQDGVKHLIHVVQPGETLYGIAKKYNITIEELMQFNEEINNMQAIKDGSKLLVPDRREMSQPNAEKAQAVIDSPQTKFEYHEVQPKETLYSLARQYGLSTQDLLEANPLIKEEGLKAGYVMKVPKQEVASETRTPIIQSDSKHFLHEVQKQETAYSIGKQYKITIDSLYALNPTIKDGLKLGQLLKLPKNRARHRRSEEKIKVESVVKDTIKVSKPKAADTTSADSDYILYKVKNGDTFFNLKQRYLATQEELLSINPELEKGLIVGKYIIIPKKEEAAELSWLDKILNKAENDNQSANSPLSGETVNKKENLNKPPETDSILVEVPRDSILVDTAKEYRVAIMLPFRAKLYADSLDVYSFFPHRDTEMASQFYFGFKLAADSLQRKGMRLNLKLFDTEGNLRVTKSFSDELFSAQLDLIVGPAYNKNSEYIADEMEDSGIPVISPLSKSVDIENRPNLIKMVPDMEAKASTIADLLNSKFSEANILFAHCGKSEQVNNVNAIMARLEPRENAFVSAMEDCEELTNTSVLNRKLSMEGLKVVVLMSEDPVFISDMISKLYALKDTNIHLIASPSVLKSPTVEYSYLNALHFTTYEVINTDYSNLATQSFVADFRKRYKTEPNGYAFQGYDAGLYFLELLWKKGPYFLESLSSEQKLSMGFKFENLEEGGRSNSYFIHSTIQSYELVRFN